MILHETELNSSFAFKTLSPYGDPHAGLYATVDKKGLQVQPIAWDQFGQASTSPDSWV